MPRKSRTLPVEPVDASKFADRQKRIEEVDHESQILLNEFYRQDENKYRMRFAEGQDVICLSQGVYYQAKIEAYYRTDVPPTFFPPGTSRADVDPQDWIPTMLVHFIGWPHQDNEEVQENEIFCCRANDDVSCHLHGILLAHEWNVLVRAMQGREHLLQSEWILDDHTYRGLEKAWQKKTGQTVGFGAYCGREDNANVTRKREDEKAVGKTTRERKRKADAGNYSSKRKSHSCHDSGMVREVTERSRGTPERNVDIKAAPSALGEVNVQVFLHNSQANPEFVAYVASDPSTNSARPERVWMPAPAEQEDNPRSDPQESEESAPTASDVPVPSHTTTESDWGLQTRYSHGQENDGPEDAAQLDRHDTGFECKMEDGPPPPEVSAWVVFGENEGSFT